MARKMVSLRLSEATAEYLLKKSKSENRTQVSIVEELLNVDEMNKSGYVDNLVRAIIMELNKDLKSMRMAINQNNRILKVHQLITNYMMLAQDLRMPYDEYGDYLHFAFEHAERKIEEELRGDEAREKERGDE